MCQYPASVTQQNRSASRERWCRRLILCLLGGLVIAFALLPDYLAAAPDNATTQPVTAEPARTEADKFKWKFIVCFPMSVDVLPARATERRQLGGAGLVRLTINGLLAVHLKKPRTIGPGSLVTSDIAGCD
ncbi:MAG: hypothetical protein ACPF9M_05675 [Candidatus Puniceispirillaceae bacterium]